MIEVEENPLNKRHTDCYGVFYTGLFVQSTLHRNICDVCFSATTSARKTAEEAGRSGTQAAKASNLTGMGLSEAKQILNVQDLEDISGIKKVRKKVRKKEQTRLLKIYPSPSEV